MFKRAAEGLGLAAWPSTTLGLGPDRSRKADGDDAENRWLPKSQLVATSRQIFDMQPISIYLHVLEVVTWWTGGE